MYHSAIAGISVYNHKVGPHQYSSASVAVEAGDGPNFNQIQVGWIVSLRKEKGILTYSASFTFYLRISNILTSCIV